MKNFIIGIVVTLIFIGVAWICFGVGVNVGYEIAPAMNEVVKQTEETEPTVLTEAIETENVIEEEVWVSKEYLEELGYNSQTNVYFGED